MIRILFVIIFSLFFCSLSFSKVTYDENNKVNLEFEHSPEIFEALLQPIWKDIPHEYNWGITTLGTLGSTISADLIKAEVLIGAENSKLFNISILSSNLIQLDWNLPDLKVGGLISVKFSYKKLGITLSHIEQFYFDASEIKKATSDVALKFSPAGLKLELKKNQFFEFEKVSIRPRNGMGKTLRWVFDNLFSKNQVDNFITTKLNEQLQGWINSKKLLNSIEDAANKELAKLSDLQIEMGEVASFLSFDTHSFNVDKMLVELGGKIEFDNTNRKIHSCALKMMDDYLSSQTREVGSLKFSHSLIEQAIMNYISYERSDEKGKLLQPLLCLGHNQKNSLGEPSGEVVDFNLGIGSIKFKTWITPFASPSFDYDENNNKISATLEFAITIEPYSGPKVRVQNGPLIAQIKVAFTPKFLKTKGLSLVYEGSSIEKIYGGDLQVQWYPLLPFMKINIDEYRNKIALLIDGQVKRSLIDNSLPVINESVELTKDLIFKLRGHQLLPNSHLIEFDLETLSPSGP